MDCFKKIAKYSFISSNIVSSLAMENKKNTEFKEVKFNSIESFGTYINEKGIFEKKILHNCYFVSDNQERRSTLINENVDYLDKINFNMFYKDSNNIYLEHEKLINIPFFILNFKNKNIEKNFIFNCNRLDNNIANYLKDILKEFGENYNIYCLGSNNNGNKIEINSNFFKYLRYVNTINLIKLNSFEFENIMSSFNQTFTNEIFLPKNIEKNSFKKIDMNNTSFSDYLHYIARTYNLNIDKVCEEYYNFSNGIISDKMIKDFEEHLKTKKSEK